MATIHTERLLLHPMTLSQLHLFLDDLPALAEELGLTYAPLGIDPDFYAEIPDAFEKIVLPKVAERQEHCEWFTHWLIIFPGDNRIVGGIGANGLPDENGEVVIGYYIDNQYAGRGFATEATAGLVSWIFKNPKTKAIIADTLVDGHASQKVLQKNAFAAAGETEEGLRWRREKEI